jgi:hypothetical protein
MWHQRMCDIRQLHGLAAATHVTCTHSSKRLQAAYTSGTARPMCPKPLGSVLPLWWPWNSGSDSVPQLCVNCSGKGTTVCLFRLLAKRTYASDGQTQQHGAAQRCLPRQPAPSECKLCCSGKVCTSWCHSPCRASWYIPIDGYIENTPMGWPNCTRQLPAGTPMGWPVFRQGRAAYLKNCGAAKHPSSLWHAQPTTWLNNESDGSTCNDDCG